MSRNCQEARLVRLGICRAESSVAKGGMRSVPDSVEEPSSVIRILVFTDLVHSTWQAGTLDGARALEVSRRHDRAARKLLARFGGLEIDRNDGFFAIFELPADAVGFALAYQQVLARFSRELDVELSARVGIHLGEVLLRRNRSEEVSRGAKPFEVEGLAKRMAARVMSLAVGRQTLLTRGVFCLARRAAMRGELADTDLRWMAHGSHVFHDIGEPLEVFEVGVEGFAPLRGPRSPRPKSA